MSKTSPQYPLYVVSYKRAESCPTAAALKELDVPFTFVVEPEDKDAYNLHHPDTPVLTVPDEYHERYETYDSLGRSKSQGPGPARNFAWEHSRKNGYDWHWVMDDNIEHFARFNQNVKIRFEDGSLFRAMENFARQYKNIAMAGPRYRSFIAQGQKRKPITTNTRVYSCNLIRNDTGYRWAGRYNEDTDLSLRMLKDGWCTIVFNTFLQDKAGTQKYEGGNTDNFYSKEGTYPKTRMLKRCHPKLVTMTNSHGNFDRWHHVVDYTPFDDTKLLKKDNPPKNDVDMSLVEYTN